MLAPASASMPASIPPPAICVLLRRHRHVGLSGHILQLRFSWCLLLVLLLPPSFVPLHDPVQIYLRIAHCVENHQHITGRDGIDIARPRSVGTLSDEVPRKGHGVRKSMSARRLD